MIRSRSTALRIPRGRRKALHRRAVFASEAAPPRRDTMRDQSLINRESEFMTPLNRLRFQRSSGYFSAYGVKPVGKAPGQALTDHADRKRSAAQHTEGSIAERVDALGVKVVVEHAAQNLPN